MVRYVISVFLRSHNTLKEIFLQKFRKKFIQAKNVKSKSCVRTSNKGDCYVRYVYFYFNLVSLSQVLCYSSFKGEEDFQKCLCLILMVFMVLQIKLKDGYRNALDLDHTIALRSSHMSYSSQYKESSVSMGLIWILLMSPHRRWKLNGEQNEAGRMIYENLAEVTR